MLILHEKKCNKARQHVQQYTQKRARARARADLIRQSLLSMERICNPNAAIKHIDVPLQLHLKLHLPLYELVSSLDVAKHQAESKYAAANECSANAPDCLQSRGVGKPPKDSKGTFLKNDFTPANILHQRSHLQTRCSRCPGKGKNKILWVFRLEWKWHSCSHNRAEAKKTVNLTFNRKKPKPSWILFFHGSAVQALGEIRVLES